MTSDYSSIEADELSVMNKINKKVRKQNKRSKKHSDKKILSKNSKLTSGKVCYQATNDQVSEDSAYEKTGFKT